MIKFDNSQSTDLGEKGDVLFKVVSGGCTLLALRTAPLGLMADPEDAKFLGAARASIGILGSATAIVDRLT